MRSIIVQTSLVPYASLDVAVVVHDGARLEMARADIDSYLSAASCHAAHLISP